MEKKHKFSYNDIDDSLIVSNRAENEMVNWKGQNSFYRNKRI